MRRSIVVLAASSCLASATWRHGRDLGQGIQARETGSGNVEVAATGWTPRPTEPPRQRVPLDLLRMGRRGIRGRQNTDTWINDETCGWFSEETSLPFTCDPGFTCATNRQNVVGCTSGASAPFFTVCLDYQAFLGSACESIEAATGCCTDSTAGACGTFLWPGSPQKSMYRCFPEPTIISMINQPREVLDSLTRTSSSSTESSSSSSTSSTTTTTTTRSSGTGTSTSSPNTTTNSSSSTNIGAIVGGAVGGVAGLAIIVGLIAYLIIRRKGKNYSAVAPSDPAPTQPGASSTPAPTIGTPQFGGPTPPQQQMAMAGGGGANGPFSPPPGGGQPGAPGTTFPPTSPYAPSVSTATTAYDPHQSYYEAPKPGVVGGHISPGQQFNAYQQPPYPPQPQPPMPGQPGFVQQQAYQPQLGTMSELDSTAGHHTGQMSELDSNAMQVGHQFNPAEMGVSTPRPQ